MIHRIYWAILLLIMVVGCTKLDTKTLVNTYDSDAINFVTQTTKAISYDIDTMQSDADGFVVYGVEVDSPSWYDNLDGNRYIFDPSYQLWEWSSSDDPLWPVPFSQMNFYAYYPERALGFSPQASSPSTLTGDIVVESSILNQTDFLASSSGDILAKPSTGVLPLSFSHIMSKVSFSVLQDAGVLTVIRQLGIENIINTGTYDYINSSWQELSNRNLGSFDDYVGSSGPFAKYGVADQTDPIRIDGHYLMLIPQTGGDGDNQTPVWDGTLSDDDRGEGVPEGAYISMRYRTSANEDTEDLVGYAFRESCSNDSQWRNNYYYSVYKLNGSYNGPLYVKVGFSLTAENLNWVAGTEYDYTLPLSTTGGIYLSEYYYDVDGTNTRIRVDGSPSVGDRVICSDIRIGVSVNEWICSDPVICTF